MDEREAKNKIPCVVEEGIIFNRRDMARVLRDLGHVRYEDEQDGTVRRRGEGVIANVCVHATASTMVVNRRLYINVNGFEFMRFAAGDEDAIELVDEQRTIRLIPLGDPVHERQAFISEGAVIAGPGALERMLGEGFYEEDLDESDEI